MLRSCGLYKFNEQDIFAILQFQINGIYKLKME